MFFQTALRRYNTHGVAVVCMEDQRQAAAFADPLGQAGPTDQIGCDHRVCPHGEIPFDNFATPNIVTMLRYKQIPRTVVGK